MITSKDKPVNHPINAVHTDLEYFVLYSDGGLNNEDVQLVQMDEIPEISENFREVLEQEKDKAASTSEPPTRQQKKDIGQPEISQGKWKEETKFQHLQEEEEGLWGMEFDGAIGKDGASIGIWIWSPFFQPERVPSNVRVCAYKLAFDCSKNEAEYEALIAGLKILKKLNAKRISVYGDSELIIKQVKGEYQVKLPRLRAYKNAVLDILKIFPEYTLTAVPRMQNLISNSLATTTSNLKVPMNSSNKFEIHVKHRPVVPDNLRYWQVFWDDNEINAFLQGDGKFRETPIEGEYVVDDQELRTNQMDIL